MSQVSGIALAWTLPPLSPPPGALPCPGSSSTFPHLACRERSRSRMLWARPLRPSCLHTFCLADIRPQHNKRKVLVPLHPHAVGEHHFELILFQKAMGRSPIHLRAPLLTSMAAIICSCHQGSAERASDSGLPGVFSSQAKVKPEGGMQRGRTPCFSARE